MIDEDTAYKLAEMASWADGGCSHCAAGICGSLNEIFPEWTWWVPNGDARWEGKPESFGINVEFRRIT